MNQFAVWCGHEPLVLGLCDPDGRPVSVDTIRYGQQIPEKYLHLLRGGMENTQYNAQKDMCDYVQITEKKKQ